MSRKVFRESAFAIVLRSPYLLNCRQVIGAGGISALQALFNSQRRQSVIRCFGNERDFLTYRQSDGAYQRQLLLGIVIARDDQLLLPVLHFHPGAKGVNGWAQTRVLLIDSLVVQRLRIF